MGGEEGGEGEEGSWTLNEETNKEGATGMQPVVALRVELQQHSLERVEAVLLKEARECGYEFWGGGGVRGVDVREGMG